MKFKKAMGATLSKCEGSFVIVYRNEVFHINEIGARIFDLCNGKFDVDDIIGKLCKVFEMKDDEKKNEIEAYLNQLLSLELVKKVS